MTIMNQVERPYIYWASQPQGAHIETDVVGSSSCKGGGWQRALRRSRGWNCGHSGWLYIRLGFNNIQEVIKYGSSPRKFDLKKLGANWCPRVPKNRKKPQLLKASQRKEGAFKLWWKWVCKQMLLATWSRDGTSNFSLRERENVLETVVFAVFYCLMYGFPSWTSGRPLEIEVPCLGAPGSPSIGCSIMFKIHQSHRFLLANFCIQSHLQGTQPYETILNPIKPY